MTGGIEAAVADALGVPVRSCRPLAGGDINLAFALELGDGRRVFAKTNPRAPVGMFLAEARGLGWLAAARAVRTPLVLAAADAAAGAPAFLLLELMEPGPRRRDFDESLGRGLAALHRAGAPGFGLDHDNFIGSLPQGNALLPSLTWPAFYRARRLEPLLARAAKRGLVAPGLQRRFDQLWDVLDDRAGPPEPPARLHGDLWGGNLIVDDGGGPCLIDPAAYGGHREIDLAMMQLFGGFDARVFAAYEESFPLAAGADERVPLYQLYPLLVHVNLFGGSYLGSVAAALDQVL